jgi:hypothetical protein
MHHSGDRLCGRALVPVATTAWRVTVIAIVAGLSALVPIEPQAQRSTDPDRGPRPTFFPALPPHPRDQHPSSE